MGGYVPPLLALPGQPETRKQVKGPWASQGDVRSLHAPTTLTWESRAGAENRSPDGGREQMAKTSAGPGGSHAEHLGAVGPRGLQSHQRQPEPCFSPEQSPGLLWVLVFSFTKCGY